jgi:tetratricopeptide (TPR) repeat protein
MINFPSKELKFAKELIDEGKYEEALNYLKSIEKNETLTLEEKLGIQENKGWLYFFLGDNKTALKIAEGLYQISQILNMTFYALDALSIKINVFRTHGPLDESINCINQSENLFKSVPREDSLKYKLREAKLLQALGWRNYYNGEMDLAVDYISKSLGLYEEIGTHSFFITSSLSSMAWAYIYKGELDLALEYDKKALSLIPKGNYFCQMMLKEDIYRNMGAIYSEKGDLDHALDHHTRSFEIFVKFMEQSWIVPRSNWAFFHIISVLLAKKSFTQAQEYMQKYKQFSERKEIGLQDSLYQLCQALMLKSSVRMRDRVEAEHLLKEIIKKHELIFTTNLALIHLCEWYFKEFQLSSQMEILDDIYPLVDQLQKNAKHNNSYSLLANVKLMQAKLALFQINMVDARKLLAESQQIADEHGFKRLAKAISKEHDKLLEELKLWESIKKTKASVSERLKLASIDEVLERMQGRQSTEPLESIDEQPVLLLIIAEGGILLFSFPFTDKWQQDDDLFGSFLSAFTSFSEEFFSKGLDRAKFGEDTILLQTVNSFSVYYLFKGQTYLAKQKLDEFSETIQSNSSIWEILERSYKSSQIIELADIPKLERLLTDIFMQ